MSPATKSPSKDSKASAQDAFISLYRKYRPQNFSEVIGQEQVVKVLEQSIAEGTIAHAYLFCGSRGTGKTSVARIFAKALGVSANDLYEIDAASNTSVDDIRELSEAVNTIPLESPYKVYILDEVHMLSKSAFNAFLKTLEEPPKHVIFILATTEYDKLPDTIVSRCQSFTFKKPTTDILKKTVIDVSKKEHASIDPASAELIALLGDGSFRDTLSILQKVLSVADKNITLELVEEITGAPKAKLIQALVHSIFTKDLTVALEKVTTAREDEIDMKVFAKLLIARLRYVLLLLSAPQVAKQYASDFPEEERGEMEKMIATTAVSPARVATVLDTFLDAYQRIGKTHIESLPLELALVRLLGQNVDAVNTAGK